MKKSTELRDHLIKTIPHLKKHPEKLLIFIEEGKVATKPGATMSFEYRYTVQLVFTDYVDPFDTITVPLLAWLETNQWEAIAAPGRRDEAIRFKAEILDHTSVDVQVEIDLSERVLVTPDKKRKAAYLCEHVGEPLNPDITGPKNWSIYLKGELIAEGQHEQ